MERSRDGGREGARHGEMEEGKEAGGKCLFPAFSMIRNWTLEKLDMRKRGRRRREEIESLTTRREEEEEADEEREDEKKA